MPLSFLIGLIGCFVDRPRWLAVVMTLLTGAILALVFLGRSGIALC
jgi:hypothetical protein